MRREQQQWERQERELAFRLLGLYKATRVVISSLTTADKNNIAELMNDPKYLSLVKLNDICKANWLQNLHLEKIRPEVREMYKGGVQLMQLQESAAVAELRQKQGQRQEQEQTDKILDSIGW